MNKLMLFFFTMFLFTKNLYAIDGINTDFNSIFNNANTEQGKKNIVPTYQGTNVPETQINVGNIENEAYKSLENNESGQFINNTFNTRPQYDTRQLGNLIDNTNKSIENNESIVNKDYCDPYNDIEYKICYKYSGQNLCPDNTYNKYCKSNLEMQCTSYESGCTTAGLELSSLPSDLDWSYNGGNGTLIIGKKTGANYWNGTCLVIDKTIEFNISNLELVEMFTLNRAVFDDYISITLNDNLVYVGPYGGTKLELITKNSGFLKRTLVDYGTGQNSCELSTIWNQYINKDLTKLLKLGKNTLKMRVIVSGSGQGSMEFILKNRCCKEHVEKWTETCNTGEKSDKCNLISKVCTKKDYTLKFEGKYIPKKCAEYEQTYTCRSSQNSCFLHHNDCQNYNIDNCILENKEFVDAIKETEKFTYRCLTPRTTPRDCGQVIRCLDGNCYENQETQDNTQDMLDAIAMLSTLNESVKTIDADAAKSRCKSSSSQIAENNKLNDYQKFTDINFTWQALKKDGYVESLGKETAEAFMSMVGTIIYKNNLDPEFIAPIIFNEDYTKALINGGTIKIKQCDESSKCLNLSEKEIIISNNTAYKPKIKALLQSMQDKIRDSVNGNNDTLTDSEKALIGQTSIPVLRIMVNTATGTSPIDIDTLSELVSRRVLNEFFESVSSSIRQQIIALKFKNNNVDAINTLTKNIDLINEYLDKNRDKLNADFKQLQEIIEINQKIDEELASQYSGHIKSVLDFSNSLANGGK